MTQVTNAGSLLLTDTSNNALTFRFSLTLFGGNYQCYNIDPAVAVDPLATSTFIQIGYTDVSVNYVSDFEVLVMTNNVYSTSQYVTGTNVDAKWGGNQVAFYDLSYNQVTTQCVQYSDFTIADFSAGFNSVCIFNACGSASIYCTTSRVFTGEVVINGYTTTTATDVDTVNPSCVSSPTQINSLATSFPTVKPTTKPTNAPTAKPSKRPTSQPT